MNLRHWSDNRLNEEYSYWSNVMSVLEGDERHKAEKLCEAISKEWVRRTPETDYLPDDW